MAYNIQMNYYDGSNYQELNPKTLLANVSDYNNYLYTKTEVDSIKNTLQDNIDNKIDGINKFSFNTSFSVVSTSATTARGNVRFADYIYNYSKIIIDCSSASLSGNYYFSFFDLEGVGPNKNELIVYEIMNSDTTNYVYFSYSYGTLTSLYCFTTLSTTRYMDYEIGGNVNGSIRVYAC